MFTAKGLAQVVGDDLLCEWPIACFAAALPLAPLCRIKPGVCWWQGLA